MRKVAVYLAAFAALSLPAVARAETAVIARIPLQATPFDVAIDPAARLGFVSAGWPAHEVAIIDIDTNAVIDTLEGVGGALAVDSTRSRMYAADTNSLDEFDSASRSWVRSTPIPPNVSSIAVDETTGRVFIAQRLGDALTVVQDSRIIATIPVGDNPISIAIDSGARRAFVANTNSNSVSIVDLDALTAVGEVPSVPTPFAVAVHPSTHEVYVANLSDGWVTVIDGMTGRIAKRIWLAEISDWGCCPDSLALNPATDRLHLNSSARVKTIDTTTNSVAATGEELVFSGRMAADPVTGHILVAEQATSQLVILSDDATPGAVRAGARAIDGPATFYAGRHATRGSWSVKLECRTTCSNIEAGVNGAPLAPYTGPLSFTEPGVYTLAFRATGVDGEDRRTRTLVLEVDRTPPTGTMRLEPTGPAMNGWTAGSWILHYSCHDPRRPNEITCLPITVAPNGYESHASTPVYYEEGIAEISYRLEDAAGNSTAPVPVRLGIDRTAPRTSATAIPQPPYDDEPGRNGWWIELACEDPLPNSPSGGSGCAETKYRIGNGPEQTYQEPIEVISVGDTDIRYRSRDILGNWESEAQKVVTVPPLPPPSTSATLTPIGATHGAWASEGWRLSLSCRPATTSALSRCARTEYWLDGGDPIAYQGPVEIAAEGIHVLRHRSYDRAGNIEPFHERSVHVDRTAPTTTEHAKATPTPSGHWTRGDWAVALSCEDPSRGDPPGASGCARTDYTIGSAAFEYERPFTLADEGTHILAFWSTDRVGHAGERQTRTYGIDRSGPQVQMDGTSPIYTSLEPVRLQGLALDPLLRDGSTGSGARAACFDVVARSPLGRITRKGCFSASSTDGVVWRADVRLGSGTYEVTMRASDAVDNRGESASVSIIVV